VTWKPITEAQIQDKINAARERMSVRQRRLWNTIQIIPEKWSQTPFGDEGGGFWAVGLIGSIVVWFNDIEDGFNRSKYTRCGVIDDYWCNQDELEQTVERLLNLVDTGHDAGSLSGLPQPGVF
jgi:hypothetical protein